MNTATFQILHEMLDLVEDTTATKKKKRPLKTAARAVYHRDYVKTKNKPYRKYDHEERAED